MSCIAHVGPICRLITSSQSSQRGEDRPSPQRGEVGYDLLGCSTVSAVYESAFVTVGGRRGLRATAHAPSPRPRVYGLELANSQNNAMSDGRLFFWGCFSCYYHLFLTRPIVLICFVVCILGFIFLMLEQHSVDTSTNKTIYTESK